MTAAKLTLSALSFERNHQMLFDEINCTVHAGEFLQIRGANGSGKSTLLRIIAGFLEPQIGALRWQDQDVTQQRDTYQQQLHYVGHQNGIKTHLTALENLDLFCALLDVKKTKLELRTILQRVGLTHQADKPALQLSAGQTRRLSLAKLLLKKNPLWILDEPTTALDADGQQLLSNLLQEHLQADGIAIVATHQNFSLENKMQTICLGEK